MSVTAEVVSLAVEIRRGDVLHFLDYPAGRTPPDRIDGLLTEVLPEARALADARGTFVELPIGRAADVGLPPVAADALVLGLVTAGAALDARVSELSREGEVTRALLLDAAGSAAAEEAANLLGAMIVGDAASEAPPEVSCRLSPGYGRWEVSAQPGVFALLPHVELGVSLTPSFMMVPRKSISFAMWLGARERITFGLGGCERCTLTRCRYRRAGAVRASFQQHPVPSGPRHLQEGYR